MKNLQGVCDSVGEHAESGTRNSKTLLLYHLRSEVAASCMEGFVQVHGEWLKLKTNKV